LSNIFKAFPFAQPHRITQAWGANPDYYEQFGLLGHDGVDLVPENYTGTAEVYACHDGEVIENAWQDNLGNYVKLEGEGYHTIYAHLRQSKVNVGDVLAAGDELGIMGSTRNSTGDHLHLTIRIYPFDRADGWQGFSDPTWELSQIDGDKLPCIYGPHVMDRGEGYRSALEKLNPSVILLLHPQVDDIAKLRQWCPQAVIVGRMYRSDGEYSGDIIGDPVAAAQKYNQLVLETPWWDQVDYVQTNNEVSQQPHWVEGEPPTELERLSIYSLEWMKLADQAGYKCAILAFSVGNPDVKDVEDVDEAMYAWKQVYPAIEYAEDHEHVVLIHEYGASLYDREDSLWHPAAEWYIKRLEEQVLPRLPYKTVKFVAGEYGWDWLIFNQKGGWLHELGPATAQQAVDQLAAMSIETQRWRSRILGYSIFCVGPGGGWESYDIGRDARGGRPLWLLADWYESLVPEPPEPPEPPIGGDMIPEVYDIQGVKQDWDWLVARYGPLEYVPAPVVDGEKYFRLMRVQATIGPANLKVRTLAEDGAPTQRNVTLHWDGADYHDTGCATMYDNHFIVQMTDSQGYTGFGMGSGAYYWPEDPPTKIGPHASWVCSSLKSDALNGIGMLSGTNHEGILDLVFQIVTQEPDYESLEEAMKGEADKRQCISLNPGAALQKQIYADGFVPVENEFDMIWDDQRYMVQKAENLSTGEARAYHCPYGVWFPVEYFVY